MGFLLHAAPARWLRAAFIALVIVPELARADDPPAPVRQPAPIAAVYDLHADTGVWRKLFDLPNDYRCNSPRVSPDGRFLAFDGWNKVAGRVNADAEVFITKLDGSDMRSICTGAMPTLSPDGKQFACSRYGADHGVWIIAVDGTAQRNLDENGWGIQWAPDGASVAWVRRGNIVVHTVATGEERLLFPEAGSPWRSIAWNMSWSADSRQIACLGYQASSSYELATVDALGAEFGFARYTTSNFVPGITWTAAGRPLVVPDKFEGKYRILQFDPARPEQPPAPLPGIPADSKATSADWTPDGSRLIVICNFN